MSEELWDCATDGHEFEQLGEYDPDTNSYPWLECIYCGKQKDWVLEDDDFAY
jgi:hypothetical protein